MIDSVFANLSAVRQTAPLVHNITNFVVMNSTANALLALGASPIMAHAPEEMEDLVSIANALVLNIGTLRKPWIDSMLLGGRIARDKNIPVVLDPVGAGASTLRTQTATRILTECSPSVIRANASEMLALAGSCNACTSERLALALGAAGGATKGVDSKHSGAGLEDVASEIARAWNCTISISGPVDIVTDGSRTCLIAGGSPMMPKVTGLGCTASALVGAFCAVADDYFEATVSAMAVMSAAGANAADKAAGPGTLQLHLYDALYSLSRDEIADTVEVKQP